MKTINWTEEKISLTKEEIVCIIRDYAKYCDKIRSGVHHSFYSGIREWVKNSL